MQSLTDMRPPHQRMHVLMQMAYVSEQTNGTSLRQPEIDRGFSMLLTRTTFPAHRCKEDEPHTLAL